MVGSTLFQEKSQQLWRLQTVLPRIHSTRLVQHTWQGHTQLRMASGCTRTLSTCTVHASQTANPVQTSAATQKHTANNKGLHSNLGKTGCQSNLIDTLEATHTQHAIYM